MKRDIDYVIAGLIACIRCNPKERIIYMSKQDNAIVLIVDAIVENCSVNYINDLIVNYLIENKQNYDEYINHIINIVMKEKIIEELKSTKGEVETAFECGEISTAAHDNIIDKLNNLESIINNVFL